MTPLVTQGPRSASGLDADFWSSVRRGSFRSSDVKLLGDVERVLDLNTEVAHGAFKLRMTKQDLHGPQIFWFSCRSSTLCFVAWNACHRPSCPTPVQ